MCVDMLVGSISPCIVKKFCSSDIKGRADVITEDHHDHVSFIVAENPRRCVVTGLG